MKNRICPCCGSEVSASTAVEGENKPPEEGDISVCIRCAAILLFNANSDLVIPSNEVMEELKASNNWPLLMETVNLIKSYSLDPSTRIGDKSPGSDT